jgi:hypothetical protein
VEISGLTTVTTPPACSLSCTGKLCAGYSFSMWDYSILDSGVTSVSTGGVGGSYVLCNPVVLSYDRTGRYLSPETSICDSGPARMLSSQEGANGGYNTSWQCPP